MIKVTLSVSNVALLTSKVALPVSKVTLSVSNVALLTSKAVLPVSNVALRVSEVPLPGGGAKEHLTEAQKHQGIACLLHHTRKEEREETCGERLG